MLDPEAPDADCLRPVALTVGTVARVYHRTLAVSGRGGPDASGRGKPGFDPYCTRPDAEVPASGQFLTGAFGQRHSRWNLTNSV